jgi:hypothetical protein
LPFPQLALLDSLTCVQLRLITVLGHCGCVAVASFLGVPSPLETRKSNRARNVSHRLKYTLKNPNLAARAGSQHKLSRSVQEDGGRRMNASATSTFGNITT